MKSICLVIAIMSVLCFTACTSVDNDPIEGTPLYESVKNTYGIEEVSYGMPNADQIPSVTLDQMQAILEALRADSNKKNNCLVELAGDANFGGVDEVNKKVVMGCEYAAKTRTGSLLENFLLRVELKFNIDNGQVFYYGTDYLFNSRLFDWRANGLSLSPAKNKDGYTYEFESESFLYFKVKDKADCLVKVGIIFKGEYNFKTEAGTYSFQLEKNSK